MDADVRQQRVELYAQVCRALSDPKRLLIIESLRDGPMSVGEIAESLGLSQPNVSQHLAILRERRIVASEREGTSIRYRLNGDRVVSALDLLRQHAHDAIRQDGLAVDAYPAT